MCLPVHWTNARALNKFFEGKNAWDYHWSHTPLRSLHPLPVKIIRIFASKSQQHLTWEETGKTNTVVWFYFILCFLHFTNWERERRSNSKCSLNFKIILFKKQPYWGKIDKGKTMPDELNVSKMLLWNHWRFHCSVWIAHILVFIADNEFLWHPGIHYGGGKTRPALLVPFSAFRHNGNVNMLNIRGLSYSLASLFVVIMSLGEDTQCLQTRGGVR